MASDPKKYPVTLEIDYPERLDRLTTFFRFFWAVPILIVLSVLMSDSGSQYVDEAGQQVSTSSGGIGAGLFVATALLVLFRQRYPKWWFNFNVELNRFSMRIGTYLAFMTDKYPSTEDAQTVHLNIKYPDAKKDLNRWLPLVKWFLAIPHYFVLIFLVIGALFVVIAAWFAILVTGKYPKGMFDYMVGVGRWGMRVAAYAFLLTTDEYPPFTLK